VAIAAARGTSLHAKSFTTDDLLNCYRRGVFPMAESRGERGFFIVDPEQRAIFPLDGFHVPKRLARTLRSGRFSFSIDRDFAAVIDACAAAAPGRVDTWINEDIRGLYTELHARGFAHSVEARIDGALAGGLYGVAIGGAFFGESMFSQATDASKAALVHLVARLRFGGFTLLDTQFMTDHLAQFGAVEMPRQRFKGLLRDALSVDGDFAALPMATGGEDLVRLAAPI
jgi:leucyl/phenylalanyl-tRNA--protein transferase